MRKKKDTGFSYFLEDEKLIEYQKLSAAEKLQWLEDVNAFTRLFQTQRGAILREKLMNKEWKRSYR